MSRALSGDLEDLHIVDIIQLLHTTRKSGTFTVKRPEKGRSRIVFSNGYIVSASHLDNRICIGTVLLKMGLINEKQLREALELQKKAGEKKQPILTTLMNMGVITRQKAIQGLKKLIEITLVELIGWNHGEFTFEPDSVKVSERCDYLPGEMEEDINLDAQMVLMDALRVYDERQRDISMGREVPSYEEVFAGMESYAEVDSEAKPEQSVETEEEAKRITPEDLGLDSIDQLKRKLPRTLLDRESFDPGQIHRNQIREMLSEFSAAEQNRLIDFLEGEKAFGIIKQSGTHKRWIDGAILLHRSEPLLKHSVMTMYKSRGTPVFCTERAEEVIHYVNRFLGKSIIPLVVIDNHRDDATTPPENLMARLKTDYPEVPIINLLPGNDYQRTLQAIRDGARAVLPRPSPQEKERFIDDLILLLESLKSYLDSCMAEQRIFRQKGQLLKDAGILSRKIRRLKDPRELSREVLRFVSQIFERAYLFIQKGEMLLSEGLFKDKRVGIPLLVPSVFQEVLEKGMIFWGIPADGEFMEKHLYCHIGPPEQKGVLLLPLVRGKRSPALIYADHGKSSQDVPLDMALLDMISSHVSLVYDNLFMRRRLSARP